MSLSRFSTPVLQEFLELLRHFLVTASSPQWEEVYLRQMNRIEDELGKRERDAHVSG